MTADLGALFERGLDPALDPLLWANAGGNVELVTSASVQTVKNRIASLRLPRPMCIMVQIGRIVENAMFLGTGVTIQADVSWQAGRGTQFAVVDVGPGTTFTLAAAQAVSITVIMTAAVPTAAHATLNCTLAPGTAANPLPAYKTDVFDSIHQQATAVTLIPAFARRCHLQTTDDALAGQLEIEYASLSGGQFTTGFSGDLVPPSATVYQIWNPTAATDSRTFAMFELVL